MKSCMASLVTTIISSLGRHTTIHEQKILPDDILLRFDNHFRDEPWPHKREWIDILADIEDEHEIRITEEFAASIRLTDHTILDLAQKIYDRLPPERRKSSEES